MVKIKNIYFEHPEELLKDLTLKVPEKYKDENTTFKCPRCKQKLLFSESMCGNERPPRKVFCQLKKEHAGSHRAIIFWEDE